MAKLKFDGLDEYVRQLEKLSDMSRECIGRAVYEGAGVIANAVRDAIEAIPIDERFVKDGQMLNGISRLQKDGLLEGFGIAPLQNDNGYMHVKLGFAGYNGVRSNQFPDGQPNSMIARSVNSGTSFRARIPFVDNTVRQKKNECEEKMKETFETELRKVT